MTGPTTVCYLLTNLFSLSFISPLPCSHMCTLFFFLPAVLNIFACVCQSYLFRTPTIYLRLKYLLIFNVPDPYLVCNYRINFKEVYGFVVFCFKSKVILNMLLKFIPIPVCVLICLLSSDGLSNALPQTSHGNNVRSPLAGLLGDG